MADAEISIRFRDRLQRQKRLRRYSGKSCGREKRSVRISRSDKNKITGYKAKKQERHLKKMPAPVFFCLFRRRRKLEVPKVHINGIFGNVQLVGNGDHGILQLENSLLIQTENDFLVFV